MTLEPNFFLKISSPIAMPTEFPSPWPKGPVVVSIPEFFLYSGWPAQIELSCLKFFSSSIEKSLYPVK